jgi:adenylylsulfate kinase-like enzyme
MIYWFTGQPGAGKTVLGNKLRYHLSFTRQTPIKLIDGDDIRKLYSNTDYSIKGRIYNVDIAQKLSHYLHNEGFKVIVCMVSPYLDQREEFKELLGNNITEIYVHTSEIRERDNFHVKGYQPPTKNYINIDTTYETPEESIEKIINNI